MRKKKLKKKPEKKTVSEGGWSPPPARGTGLELRRGGGVEGKTLRGSDGHFPGKAVRGQRIDKSNWNPGPKTATLAYGNGDRPQKGPQT